MAGLDLVTAFFVFLSFCLSMRAFLRSEAGYALIATFEDDQRVC